LSYRDRYNPSVREDCERYRQRLEDAKRRGEAPTERAPQEKLSAGPDISASPLG
jgi:hypothetical protein